MDSVKPFDNDQVVTIDSVVITDEEIEIRGLETIDLFEVKMGDKIVGPIYKVALKENLENFDLDDSTLIRNMASEHWVSLYEHPFFQRRGLKIIAPSTEPNPNNEYFILNLGQKDGPFTIEEIEKRINDKELLFTDTISTDLGKSWIKIFELEKFNRRNIATNELPVIPKGNAFEHSKLEVIDNLHIEDEKQETEEAIVGLAFIHNVNVNKAEDKSLDEATKAMPSRSTSNVVKLSITLTAMVILAVTWALLSGKSTQERTPSSEILTPKKAVRVEPIKRVRQAPRKRTVSKQKAFSKPKVSERGLSKTFEKKMKKSVPFGESDAYKFRSDFNEGADPGAFAEGEVLSPDEEISPDEMLRLQERLKNSKFSIKDLSGGDDGPDSEGGLFDEEASF